MDKEQKTAKLMTVEEVAERLNASTSFVYQLLATGELRHFVLGKKQGGKRVSEEQLQDYLHSRERGGPRAKAQTPSSRRRESPEFVFLPPPS